MSTSRVSTARPRSVASFVSTAAANIISSQPAFVPMAAARHNLTAVPLSIDQRPDRPDERIRLAGCGARVEAYKDVSGMSCNLLRVLAPDASMVRLPCSRCCY